MDFQRKKPAAIRGQGGLPRLHRACPRLLHCKGCRAVIAPSLIRPLADPETAVRCLTIPRNELTPDDIESCGASGRRRHGSSSLRRRLDSRGWSHPVELRMGRSPSMAPSGGGDTYLVLSPAPAGVPTK